MDLYLSYVFPGHIDSVEQGLTVLDDYANLLTPDDFVQNWPWWKRK